MQALQLAADFCTRRAAHKKVSEAIDVQSEYKAVPALRRAGKAHPRDAWAYSPMKFSSEN